MAKNRRQRRRSGNFQVIPEDGSITLLTLGSNTAIEATGITLAMDCKWISADVVATLDGGTELEDPVMFGIAAANLTVTQIKECLEASPTTKYNYPAVEHAARPVKILGAFLPSGAASVPSKTLNGGRSVRARLSMIQVILPASDKLPQFFAWNRSGAALTTGGVVRFQAKHYVNWRA